MCVSVSAILVLARAATEDTVEFMVASKVELWMAEEMVSERDAIECWTFSAVLIVMATIQSLRCMSFISD